MDDDKKEEGSDLPLSLPTQLVKDDFIDVKMPHYCAHNKTEEADSTVPSDRRWNFELFSKLPVLKLNILVK